MQERSTESYRFPEADPARDTLTELLHQGARRMLSEAGFESVNLGPHTPNQAFRHAVDLYEPELAWIALTSDLDDAGRDEVISLMEMLWERDVRIVVGGRMAYDQVECWPGYVVVAESMNRLSAQVRDLAALVEDSEAE